MIQIYECQIYDCPTCGRASVAFAELKATGKIVCPSCAPVPDRTPHDYRPIMLGGVSLISGVCCGDAGDCGHKCGVA